MLKRKIFKMVSMSMACVFFCVGCVGGNATNNAVKKGTLNKNIPDYTKQKIEMDMYAYVPPTSGYYTTTTGRGVYGDTNQTIERYQEYKDCGLNVVLMDDIFYGSGEGAGLTVKGEKKAFEESHIKTLMDRCEEVGLKVIVFDYRIWRLSRSETELVKTTDEKEPLWFQCGAQIYHTGEAEYDKKTKNITLSDGSQMTPDFIQYQFDTEKELRDYVKVLMSSYHSHPAFYGVRFFDEPEMKKLVGIGQTTKVIKSLHPDCYVLTCLLPYYGGTHDILSVGDEDSFVEYLDTYIVGSQNDHFGYDFYPFAGDVTSTGESEDAYIRSTYVRTLQLSAQKAKEHDVDWEITIQSYRFPDGGNRMINENDIRMQHNMALAFDASDISYFTYWMWQFKTNGLYQAIMGDKGEKILYDEVQKVNAETRVFAQALLNFDYVCTYLSWDKDYDSRPSHFADVETEELSNVKEVFTNRPTVINEMYDEKNKVTGYMVVNASDTNKELYDRVEIQFDGYERAVVYTAEGPKEVELEDHTYLTVLKGGEAVFVLPY